MDQRYVLNHPLRMDPSAIEHCFTEVAKKDTEYAPFRVHHDGDKVSRLGDVSIFTAQTDRAYLYIDAGKKEWGMWLRVDKEPTILSTLPLPHHGVHVFTSLTSNPDGYSRMFEDVPFPGHWVREETWFLEMQVRQDICRCKDVIYIAGSDKTYGELRTQSSTVNPNSVDTTTPLLDTKEKEKEKEKESTQTALERLIALNVIKPRNCE